MVRHLESLAEGHTGRPGRVAAVGVFDGVHRGHQRILEEALAWARDRQVSALALTFSTHPDAVVRGKAPPLIVSLQRRIEIIESLGFDATLLLPFNDRIRRIPAESFALDFLVRGLGLDGVVVGPDFRFGHGAKGSPELLAGLGRAYGLEVRVIEPVLDGGRVISSSGIRALIEAGDVDQARRLLGRPFHLRGQVVLGQRRGHTIGFPTLNLAPGTLLRPATGVYATQVERADGRVHAAVTNVGVCPTFGRGAPLTVESHVLDFEEEIYGEEVGVAFHHRLRGERKFPSPDALREQILADIARARELFEQA